MSMTVRKSLLKPLVTLVLPLMLSLLSACGTDSGADTKTNPDYDNGGGGGSVVYTGADPANQDVLLFKQEVWDKLVDSSRGCYTCHSQNGPGAPAFVRSDDINLAYQAMLPLVNTSDVGASSIVTKMAGGHNCWRDNDSVCADDMEQYLQNWLNSAAGGSTEVILTDPELREPGATKIMPGDSALYASTIYPLVQEYCSACHASISVGRQSPFFADANVNTAYDAAKSKINLTQPANSQFVTRLQGGHNCWSACSESAAEMLAAVTAFANGITASGVDPQLTVNSKAMTLLDGIVASSGGRYDTNVIALYQFKTGEGTIAYDSSGVDPALDLNLSGDYQWVTGWGVRFGGNGSWGKAQGSTDASKKLFNLITGSGEYSIETWVAPANVVQEGPARIISYSASTTARNFTLGQTQYNYDFLNRTSNSDNNGEPALSTADDDERLQATLQHVVVTYSPVNGRRIYVNGEYTGDADATTGNLSTWNDTYALVLGAETSRAFPWAGVLKLVAIHNRALTEEQILQNFNVGVGEKFYVLFNVTDFVGIPQSYVVFEVSEYDNYSYLFNAPFFISLSNTTSFSDIRLKSLRIGINGKEAPVGQAYKNIDLNLTDEDYAANNGRIPLSRLGTVIQREHDKRTGTDEFFLSFEILGNGNNVIAEPEVTPTPVQPQNIEQPDIGLKTFEEINASMAAMTGITMQENPAIATLYNTVKQQLPTVESVEGFLSSQQMAITQLAIKYCDALVENTSKRSAFFPGLNFAATPNVALADTTLLINPLLTHFVGQNLSVQPADNDVRSEINGLVDTLNTCPSNCTSARTAAIVKGSCAAVLGSATTLLQ